MRPAAFRSTVICKAFPAISISSAAFGTPFVFVRCSRVKLISERCDTQIGRVASQMHPICRNAPFPGDLTTRETLRLYAIPAGQAA